MKRPDLADYVAVIFAFILGGYIGYVIYILIG